MTKYESYTATLNAMAEPFHCTPYQAALDAMTTQLPHATSQEADEPQQRDGRNLFRIFIDTLEVLEAGEAHRQYLDKMIQVLDETVPGSDERAYRVSRVSLEAIVT